jgi:geranylgeranyl pyrophosphate synthase
MYIGKNAKKQSQKILEENGGEIADKAANVLLLDHTLKSFCPEMTYVFSNWRDALRPAMIRLAFEAVGGQATGVEIEDTSIAMSLMNLSFFLWDDIIDETNSRLFRPTFFGKFGGASGIVFGGLISAKAYTVLSRAHLDSKRQAVISEMFWQMWVNMAEAEKVGLKARKNKYKFVDKLEKINKESSASLETCLKIGAFMGNGTEEEICHLGKYGRYVGTVLDLQHDFRVSMNLTFELAEKIRAGALPCALLWSLEHSQRLQREFEKLRVKPCLGPEDTSKIIAEVLEAGGSKKIQRIILKSVEKAIEELEDIQKNSASMALRKFAEFQPQIFCESLNLARSRE